MLRGFRGSPGTCASQQPYDVYADMDFDIPVGVNGDCYDRYLVRVAREMRQSNRIIQQCVAWLRANPGRSWCRQPQGGAPRIASRSMKSNMEELIHHFKLFTEGFHVPPGEAYSGGRAPQGRVSASIIVSDGANKPFRLKIRAPACRICSGAR